MTAIEEKYAKAVEALKAIATFGHVEECDCKRAPIYECGCYKKSQWVIARECLKELNE